MCTAVDNYLQLNSRWALCDQSNEKIHVVDEGRVVRAGQVLGFVFVSGPCVFVHVDNTIFHTRYVAQVFRKAFNVEGILAILGWGCEDWINTLSAVRHVLCIL